MRPFLLVSLVAALSLPLAGCPEDGGGGGGGDDDDDAGTSFPNPGAVDVPPIVGGLHDPLPDLTVDENMLDQSWFIDDVDMDNPANQNYYECAIAEGCMPASGQVRLLKFDVGVVNLGQVDLILGDPSDHPEDFEYGACHDHLHYKDFAKYELSGPGGVKFGVKQAFCLIDLYDFGNNGDPGPAYDCGYQGISQGWGDIYDSSLDCQWINITGLAPGSYDLTVNVNADHKIPEAGPYPNTATVTIDVD